MTRLLEPGCLGPHDWSSMEPFALGKTATKGPDGSGIGSEWHQNTLNLALDNGPHPPVGHSAKWTPDPSVLTIAAMVM